MTFNLHELLVRQADGGYKDSPLAKALDRLPPLKRTGPWLAGGALRRTLLNETIDDSDLDFFFADFDQATLFEDGLIARGAKTKYHNDKQTTWIVPAKDDAPPLTVQVIMLRWYDSPDAVVDSFDFTLCQFAFDGVVLTCGEYALWDLGRKRLVPHNITYGVASIRRIIKYTRQGFCICGGGIAGILEQIVKAPDIIHAETKYID